MKTTDDRRELFRLGPKAAKLIDDTGDDIIRSTLSAMCEMDLLHFPFDEIDIECSREWGERVFDFTSIDKTVKFQFLEVRLFNMTADEAKSRPEYRYDDSIRPGEADFVIDPNWQVGGMAKMFLDGTPQHFGEDRVQDRNAVFSIMSHAALCLIFLLATENAEKSVEDVKPPKGRKKPGSFQSTYRRVTTISGRATSSVSDTTSTGKSGVTRITHVRRGHIRRQHYGPNNALIKKVWIAPIIVNADKGFLAPREAYNVSL